MLSLFVCLYHRKKEMSRQLSQKHFTAMPRSKHSEKSVANKKTAPPPFKLNGRSLNTTGTLRKSGRTDMFMRRVNVSCCGHAPAAYSRV